MDLNVYHTLVYSENTLQKNAVKMDADFVLVAAI